ncbi:MAG: hypothetical protein BV456_07605 [Thermoplasmata archaeon M8B2D]|nr:MAG: hypothetical protein BV456_07605 [Thermoplasmata archaeon M8B2D]
MSWLDDKNELDEFIYDNKSKIETNVDESVLKPPEHPFCKCDYTVSCDWVVSGGKFYALKPENPIEGDMFNVKKEDDIITYIFDGKEWLVFGFANNEE